MANGDLPIFELPLVLLPGERIPLHIFEERYKRMIGRSLDEGEPFGIVLRDADGARSIGCTARVDEVLDRTPDGKLDIVVSGEEPFRVIDRYEAPEYPVAEVDVMPAAADPADELGAEAAREAFAELAERATGERPDPLELEDASAYAIAARIELPDETKQLLLETRDEDERMELLSEALRAVDEALEQNELVADLARSNGRVVFER